MIGLNPFVEEEDKEVYDLIPSLPLRLYIHFPNRGTNHFNFEILKNQKLKNMRSALLFSLGASVQALQYIQCGSGYTEEQTNLCKVSNF